MNKKDIYLVCTMDGLMYGEGDLSTHCAFTDSDEAEHYCKKLNQHREKALSTPCPFQDGFCDGLSEEDENEYQKWQLMIDKAEEQGPAFIRIITLYDGVYDEE